MAVAQINRSGEDASWSCALIWGVGYSRFMIEHARHVPLRTIPWSKGEAATAIEDIVADGLEHFDVGRFWPAQPLEEGTRDGHTSFYFGATGMIWGIEYLGRVGAMNTRFDFRSVLPRLLEANRAELPNYEDYAAHGSLLFGDLGTALLVNRPSGISRSTSGSPPQADVRAHTPASRLQSSRSRDHHPVAVTRRLQFPCFAAVRSCSRECGHVQHLRVSEARSSRVQCCIPVHPS
jgi:hypothetical protein